MIEDDHAVIARQNQELSGEVIIPAREHCLDKDNTFTCRDGSWIKIYDKNGKKISTITK